MKLEKFKETILGFSRVVGGVILAGLLLVLLAPLSDAQAASFTVTDVSEFQAALDTAAANGEADTINVTAGTYNVSTTLIYWSSENYSLTIIGAGVSLTILDGGNSRQILNLETTVDNAGLRVRGIAFHNGNSMYGGGLQITTNSATIAVESSEFNGNSSSQVGGGVNAYSTTGNISVSNCSFEGNTSGDNAAGLFAQSEGSGTSMSLMGCSFNNNSAARDAGGAMLYPLGSGASITVENNNFESNQAGAPFGCGGGGWIRAPGGNITVKYRNNTFLQNASLGEAEGGGGTYIELPTGLNNTLNYSGNTYNNNSSATSGGGTWIYCVNGIIDISENTFTENSAAQNGGGIAFAIEGGTIIFSRNVLDSNSASDLGGGLNAAFGGTLNVFNNTFYNNSASEAGGIYFYGESTAQTDILNNILWHDTPQGIAFSGGIPVTARYSDIENGTGEPWFGTGCIDQDPLFANPTSGNFYLTWTNFPTQDATKSPCIDAGDPASPLDPDGTVADMGAFYFNQYIISPDIKVNGSDGPITLNQWDTLNATVALDNNDITDNADWWLAAQTAFGLYFYTFSGWVPYTQPTYQGSLFYLDSYEVFSTPVFGLPAGTYTLSFAVDTNMDSNITWNCLHSDSVVVNVAE